MPMELTVDFIAGAGVLSILVTENSIFSQTFRTFVLRFPLWSNQSSTSFGLRGHDDRLTETSMTLACLRNRDHPHLLSQCTELQQIIGLGDKGGTRIDIATDDRSTASNEERSENTGENAIAVGNQHLFSIQRSVGRQCG